MVWDSGLCEVDDLKLTQGRRFGEFAVSAMMTSPDICKINKTSQKKQITMGQSSSPERKAIYCSYFGTLECAECKKMHWPQKRLEHCSDILTPDWPIRLIGRLSCPQYPEENAKTDRHSATQDSGDTMIEVLYDSKCGRTCVELVHLYCYWVESTL